MPKRLGIVGPYQAKVLEYTEPVLGTGEVRVRTEVASGKHGTTTAMFDGRTFRGQEFNQEMRLFVDAGTDSTPRVPTPEAPWNAGTTGVGSVVEVGPGVERWQVGDRVFGLMDVRETNVCRQDRVWPLGDIEPALALCIEPAYVAFHAIRESQVRYGDQVAVIGLGVLGLLAVRMAVLAGAEMVLAVDPLAQRREAASAQGADYVLDPAQDDVALQIHGLTGGSGVDVAIELAGVYPALQTALRSVRVAGTVCSAGFYQGEAHGLWLGREWHHNRLTVIVPHGCGWGHPPRDFPRWDEQRAYDTLASMMAKGRLTANGLIEPMVDLEDGPEIFRLMQEAPDQIIKYAVRFAR